MSKVPALAWTRWSRPVLLATALTVLSSCGRGAAPEGAYEKTELYLPSGFSSIDWGRFFSSPEYAKIKFSVFFGDPSPYQHNTKEPFLPASNAKLFTAALAMQQLGPEFRFETRLSWKRSSKDKATIEQLVITGEGDPTWAVQESGEPFFASWARKLRELGIRRIVGPIVWLPKDSRWVQNPVPQGWTEDDLTKCYGAQAYAFNSGLNCATAFVRNSKSGWTFTWADEHLNTPLRFSAVTDQYTRLEVRRYFDANNVQGFEIFGSVAKNAADLKIRLPVPEFAMLDKLRSDFEQALDLADIRHSKELLASPGAFGLIDSLDGYKTSKTETLSFYSAALPEVLRVFLKYSVNPIGDALWKAVGSRWSATSPHLLEAGERAMEDFLLQLGTRTARKVDVPVSPGFFHGTNILHDGSGLSRASFVTGEAVMALLRDFEAGKPEEFAALWNALPTAGVDGTLENRMKNTAAQGVLRGKTGTLAGVYNLSGYVPRIQNGAPVAYLPFVMLTRTTRDQEAHAQAAHDRAGARLAEVFNQK